MRKGPDCEVETFFLFGMMGEGEMGGRELSGVGRMAVGCGETVGRMAVGWMADMECPRTPDGKTAYSGRYPFINSGDIRSARW